MDRFIVVKIPTRCDEWITLKSNMDRFIVYLDCSER